MRFGINFVINGSTILFLSEIDMLRVPFEQLHIVIILPGLESLLLELLAHHYYYSSAYAEIQYLSSTRPDPSKDFGANITAW